MKLLKNPLVVLTTFIFFIIILFLPFRQAAQNLNSEPTSLIESFRQKLTPAPQEKQTYTLMFGGDVMLGRTIMTKSQEVNDYNYPFIHIATTTSSADLTLVNLENPFVTDCPPHYEGYIFCSVPEMAKGLTYAGIDVVNLANNHTLNYGQRGLDESKSVLNNIGVSFVGLDNLVTKKVNNNLVGFLGFDFLTNKPTEEDYAQIKDADQKVDVLVVTVHWGVEYEATPRDYQREWAQEMIKNGADIIVGHHPHWVQEIEYFGPVPVYYSLGNLVFDQMWSEETKTGLLIKLTIDEDNNIISEERIPTYMEKWAQPVILEAESR